MTLYAFVVACLLVLIRFDHCNSKRMICEDIEQAGENTESSVTNSPCQPGEKGFKGAEGHHGFTGLPGKVDYERLEEIVAERVSEETQNMKKRIHVINEKLQNLTLNTPPLPVPCDGVAYNGRCFWAEVHQDNDTTFYDAYEICKRKNYELANFINKGQYNAVVQYLESMLVQRTYIQIWTGMEKIYKEYAAKLSNGAQSHFTQPRLRDGQWYKASSRKTHVYIHVQNDDLGMGAIWPSFRMKGALCQYYID